MSSKNFCAARAKALASEFFTIDNNAAESGCNKRRGFITSKRRIHVDRERIEEAS